MNLPRPDGPVDEPAGFMRPRPAFEPRWEQPARLDRDGTSVVILGAGGGPDAAYVHSGVAAAVCCRGAVYLVDFGAGVGREFKLAGLRFADLRAGFLTHLHSDHMAELYGLFSTHYYHLRGPVELFGPGRAGTLPDVPGAATVRPDLPTPGMTDTLASMRDAFAYDNNVRIRDEAMPLLLDGDKPLLRPHDLPAPSDALPFLVYDDGLVTVTATLVHHPPIVPAFAFRFDTPDGSVVFSGDTAPCQAVVELARGADVLVHEVIHAGYLEWAVETQGWPAELVQHLLGSHTPDRTLPADHPFGPIEGVGAVARRAGVGRLVLNHLVPSYDVETSTGRVFHVPGEEFARIPAVEFRGPVSAGSDGLRVDL